MGVLSRGQRFVSERVDEQRHRKGLETGEKDQFLYVTLEERSLEKSLVTLEIGDFITVCSLKVLSSPWIHVSQCELCLAGISEGAISVPRTARLPAFRIGSLLDTVLGSLVKAGNRAFSGQ